MACLRSAKLLWHQNDVLGWVDWVEMNMNSRHIPLGHIPRRVKKTKNSQQEKECLRSSRPPINGTFDYTQQKIIWWTGNFNARWNLARRLWSFRDRQKHFRNRIMLVVDLSARNVPPVYSMELDNTTSEAYCVVGDRSTTSSCSSSEFLRV